MMLKNFWNIFLLITATLALGLFLLIRYHILNYIEPITYDTRIDKVELRLCDADDIPQYYSVTTGYNGGERAIKNKLLSGIEKEGLTFGTKNGNISIRFIVNCQGEIGLFRAKGTNAHIEETDFAKDTLDALISLVSQLNDWQVKAYGDKKYDSYYYINFKIKNGRVTDIY